MRRCAFWGCVFCATAREHKGETACFAAVLDGLTHWADAVLPPRDAQTPAAADRDSARRRLPGRTTTAQRTGSNMRPTTAWCAGVMQTPGPLCCWPSAFWNPFPPAAMRCWPSTGAAAAKSTLAAAYGAGVRVSGLSHGRLFLPPGTAHAGTSGPAGENVHHERFLREALEPFAAGQPVRFCPFDCSAGVPGSAVEIPAASFAVVEGSYSLHPSLRGHYTASVFVTCAQAVQRTRLTAEAARIPGPYLKRAGFRWRKPILRPTRCRRLQI